MKRHLDYSNKAPVYTMWRILEPQRESVRKRLAREWDVDAEEIALTRNASEGLQICQLGFDLERGDEVLTTNQDYPRMITTFQQRERREGIVLKQFSIPVPAEDPGEIVDLFERRITPRTRLILMCHMINLTGQIRGINLAPATALAQRHSQQRPARQPLKGVGERAPLVQGNRAIAQDLVDELHSLRDAERTVMLVGHEPTSSELIAHIVGGGNHRLPTAGLARMDTGTTRWRELGHSTGRLEWLVNPRLLLAAGV